jgi:hypothetical protein
MMHMKRLRKGLDFVGMLALCGSAGVLGELLLDQAHWWSVAVRPPAELFLIFQTALLIAVSAFVGARVLQITDIVKTTPVRVRQMPAVTDNVRDLTLADRSEVVAFTPDTPPELPRAA